MFAKAAIDQIRALYRIEQEIEDLSDEKLLRVRQARAKPRVEAFFAWLGILEGGVLPKGPLREVIRHAWNQGQALARYLEYGRLSIDNNAAERALRPFAVGRKNWLFFQRESGGKTAAALMSLLMTAKAQAANLQDYPRDAPSRISLESDPAKVSPKGWNEHFLAEGEAAPGDPRPPPGLHWLNPARRRPVQEEFPSMPPSTWHFHEVHTPASQLLDKSQILRSVTVRLTMCVSDRGSLPATERQEKQR